MTTSQMVHVNRRTTLGWLATAVALSATGIRLPFHGQALADPTSDSGLPDTMGYGNDPNLFDPHAPWPRIMTPSQLRDVATLADMILPKAGSYPAPSEVGIADFVDEWISAPYPDQKRDRTLILDGLVWLDNVAKQRWQSDFGSLDPGRQMQLFEPIVHLPVNGDAEAMKAYHFFRRLRTVAVGAYFSLPQNFEQMGYIGNVAMDSFPPPTAEENAFIDRALAKLNL